MPIATPKQFAAMLDAAQAGGYAYPAINCANLSTLNAALKGFADKKSDGIIQFSTGAGQFISGLNHKNAVLGAMVLAEAAHTLADQYNVFVALNTDHCPPDQAGTFLKKLIEATAARRRAGKNNLFQNHMLDASNLPLAENMALSREYLTLCAENEIVLEVEAGVVGGEEDGAAGSHDTPQDKLYTTPEDMLAVYEALNGVGRYTFAATFGNVHGSYKPGAVKLRSPIAGQPDAHDLGPVQAVLRPPGLRRAEQQEFRRGEAAPRRDPGIDAGGIGIEQRPRFRRQRGEVLLRAPMALMSSTPPTISAMPIFACVDEVAWQNYALSALLGEVAQ
jgi:fructose-bisphosphate aldolase class II